ANPTDITTPDYWVRHLRGTVRYHQGIQTLHTLGVTTFLEIGPDATLATLTEEILDGAERRSRVASALRRGRGEQLALLTALAEIHVEGHPVDWRALTPPPGEATGRPVDLPTYPFQRRRFWIGPPAADADATGLGLLPGAHPLLAATVDVAETGASVFTGRLSVDETPWLADHAIAGTILLPGAALVDLALHAAAHAGGSVLAELTLAAPVTIPHPGTRTIQVTLGGQDEAGRRPLTVHTAPDGAEPGEDPGWVRHATGTVITAGPAGADGADGADGAHPAHGPWPPAGAETIDVSGHYDRLAEAGYDYGPAFQGLRAAWRDGDDIVAEVAAEAAEQAGYTADAAATGTPGHVLHPALLDAALHAISLLPGAGSGAGAGGIFLPFSWEGVRLLATGGTSGLCLLYPSAPLTEPSTEDGVLFLFFL
ncbi:polyketide synthase dehydratase domain-containing protein, partial [Parafrankia sp. FMc2]|uniref:polyketide synthase dehydratase domain-containing protein n=1 Tax=Parafrankia sp. FMc2 TaxID=3233196 RepID=UPI0034D46566